MFIHNIFMRAMVYLSLGIYSIFFRYTQHCLLYNSIIVISVISYINGKLFYLKNYFLSTISFLFLVTQWRFLVTWHIIVRGSPVYLFLIRKSKNNKYRDDVGPRFGEWNFLENSVVFNRSSLHVLSVAVCQSHHSTSHLVSKLEIISGKKIFLLIQHWLTSCQEIYI